MLRRIAALCLGFAAVSAVRGQAPEITTIHLTVRPADAPKPSLKYRLYPDPDNQTSGNAPTGYYRALSMFVENPLLLQELRKDEELSTWAETPLADLPRQEVRNRVGSARDFLREIEVASRKRQCDWQLEGRSEGIGLLIPDVAGMRMAGAVLAVKARLQIAEAKYADAIRTLQTGYAVAHHLGKGPSFPHLLVGMWIANLMNNQLDDLIQQADAPNLYWALATVPHPFATLQPVLADSRLMYERMLPMLKRMDNGPMTMAQVNAAKEEVKEMLDQFRLAPPTALQNFEQVLLQAKLHAEAKQFLVHHGYTAEDVDAMPVFQVVTLFAFRDRREAWDEAYKFTLVEDGVRSPGFKQAVSRCKIALDRLDSLYFHSLLKGLGGDGFPNVEHLTNKIGRHERHLAALRCVEALRLYAAAHDGKWPATLKDVKEVPLPVDPVTSLPFGYQVEGDSFTLSSPVIAGEKPPAHAIYTYEVKLKR